MHVTESPEDCELQCYLEDDCMSINIGIMGDETYYCELSDSDHVVHPRDLENQKDVSLQISTGENLSIQLTDQFFCQSYSVRGCIQISF